jgi:hypothetical protein
MVLRVLKTEYGTFNVNIDDDIVLNFRTREKTKVGMIISVGGIKKCVFIKIPNIGNTAKLLNLKVKDSGCNTSGANIKGVATVGMINLAFTILREIAPDIQYIELDDESDFTCTLPNGKTVGISMTLHDLLFYQKAYYEKRFGAYLKDPDLREEYQEYKKGFQAQLPHLFSFKNTDLNEMLGPIYIESTTWEDFLSKLSTIKNKCEIIYPWYKNAVQIIFNEFKVERRTWIINLYDNILTPTIQYSEIKSNQKGGKRKTRKRMNWMIYDEPYDYLMYDEIYNLKYK